MVKRYTLLPVPENEKELFEYYLRHVSTFWTVNEVIFDADKEEFVALDVNVQNWLKTTLAFFASSDVLINQNIFENFLSEVEIRLHKRFIVSKQQWKPFTAKCTVF